MDSPTVWRAITALGAWLRNRDPPAVGSVTDGTVPGPDGDIPVRVYRPEGAGPFPTVVFFHGGGFVSGSLDSHDAVCRYLARESDCVVCSVAYRLAPEHPFPAAVEDAIAATEWAAQHPDRLDGDGRLAVAGDSAGGNLAAVTTLAARDRDGPDIDYQALLYPGIGVREDQASVRDHGGTILTRGDIEAFRDWYYGSDIHLENPYGDPARACDHSDLPPATVLTAGHDPLRDGGRAYADQLDAAGVDVTRREYSEMIHGFVSMSASIDAATDAIADVASDVRDGFAG
ncbi:alpha/beta hydrolase fold domain-containing protein [Halapricum sp. CBA1109]|uniref:alpha/beta hydrolase n=1 Tax=Halapricum sp. CBA1109 TaxID=2668068 RepID=UPI0012FBC96F|nr:alpha/beta hydrolase [Halapricum sp. CBA1109]MUV89879.1 alpha/beta hydrolase fold domain-containing protein [Halapricum sp. CBA1109]